MKRTLSLVLALIMVLGSFTTVFAATEAEKTAAEFLEDEGILRGADGDLMLDKNLERRDAVVLLSRLLDAEEIAEDFEVTEDSPSWEDARTDAYYVPFFAWAEENGYFEGDDEGNFNPRNAITAQEYALVLLRALGYEDGEWNGVLETAEKNGLLKDVEVENKDEVVRGQMAVMTFNALGAKMFDSDETLAEFLGIEMPEEEKATELEAEVFETENLAEIVVELSNADLVRNKEALTNPNNYRLNNDAKVKNVHLDGDNVVLTLVPYGEVTEQEEFDVLTKGKKFELTIRNIDPAINKTYKGILANDNAIPAVESIDFMGDYGIKVTTSEPIFEARERNFRLDSRTSMIVEQYGREIILTPYHNVSFDEEAVELTVDRLEDFAGYLSAKTVEEMELSSDDALPQVEAAYRSGSKLTLVFDRDVYLDSIKDYENRRETGNVNFVERRVTFYAEDAVKVDTNVVEYFFERDIPKNVEVEVSGVANHFNKAMETEVVVPVEYEDEYAPIVISHTKDVKITEAEQDDLDADAQTKFAKDFDQLSKAQKEELLDDGREVATAAMTITFDKHIAEFIEYLEAKTADKAALEAELVKHFVLYESDVTRRNDVTNEVTIKVDEVHKDKDKIKLTFEGIKLNNPTREFDYVLEVRDFTDTNRNRMDREYLEFQVISIDDAFAVVSVKVNNETYYNRNSAEIVIEFNDYVNKEEASNHRNYYLDGKLKVDEAIVERDGETVTLVVFDTTATKLKADYEILEISPRVQNLDDDLLAHRFFYVDGGEQATDPAKEAAKEKALEEAIAAAVESIDNLPEEITLEDEDAVVAARKLVDDVLVLDEEAVIENLSVLEAAEDTIANLKDEAADEEPEVPGEDEEPEVPGEDEVTANIVDVDSSTMPGITIVTVELENIPEGKTAEDYNVIVDGEEATFGNGKFAIGLKKVVTQEQLVDLIVVESK